MLLLLLTPAQPVPTPAAYVNFALAANELWPPLNAAGPADAVFWTETDLYDWFNQAAKQLAIRGRVFTRYDHTSIVIATGTAAYVIPDDQINTVQADMNGLVLRPRNVQQLEALDNDWPSTTGAPNSFAQDTQGMRQLTLYPKPTVGSNGKIVGLAIEVFPDDLTSAAAILALPQCLREYFTFFALGEARLTKETRAQMPEIAKWCKSVVSMLDGVVAEYWGQEPGT